jgi:hypothetical protein
MYVSRAYTDADAAVFVGSADRLARTWEQDNGEERGNSKANEMRKPNNAWEMHGEGLPKTIAMVKGHSLLYIRRMNT